MTGYEPKFPALISAPVLELTMESDSKSSMQTLTRANYQSWMAMAKDYIYALDHEDAPDIWNIFVWRASEGTPNDPIDHDFQVATTAPAKKLRVQHNKAFAYLRRHLSTEIFETTLRLPTSQDFTDFFIISHDSKTF